ncbi:glyoxalase-like domain-containing [Fusarium albosuccineum]|uniref:Glyoxalase-like domain-containing n=1 Tax=Fusarium albosuccineum TaxID=1237068 RepID=A0A8H4LHX7_9HYPO|nr:glyoxalase-like domain-containing [Fusarium albosuccineum]
MSDWKPPAYGTPVWMGIPAHDVSRGRLLRILSRCHALNLTYTSLIASQFYDTVFKFSFKDESDKYPKEQIRMFDFNPSLGLTGGIQKAPDHTGNFYPGKGGVCVYWFVENVDSIAATIEKAGGKMLTEKEKEGEHGLFRFFEDTEGTVGAVYQIAGAC